MTARLFAAASWERRSDSARAALLPYARVLSLSLARTPSSFFVLKKISTHIPSYLYQYGKDTRQY